MAGGKSEIFSKIKDTLSLMGKNIVYCGDMGSGQVAKLCNNMLLAISMIGTSECMNLGIKYVFLIIFLKLLFEYNDLVAKT